MISSRSISAAILLTANISTVVAADPVVDDKPLKYWVERLNSNDETVRKAAAESLGQTAHEWFELRAQFSDEGITYCDRIRREAKPLIPTLIKRLGDPFDESRECAAYMIALVGPDAEAARPALLKMIRGERRSSGLPMAGAIALLHVTSPTRAVAREFLELVRDAPSEKSNNAPAVKDESSKPFGDDIIASMVGDYLAQTFALAGHTTIEIPALEEVTQSKFPREMRLTAIAILAEWGTEAKTAVPSLRKLLVDDDRMIRAFSGRALVSIELDKDEIPGILATMRLGDNENADFEKWTKDFFDSQAETRKLVRDAGAEFVLAAVRQLEHGNPFYQRRAMRMLGVIGPASKVAIPAIIKAASSDDEATRATAMETLTQIDPSAVPLKLRRNARK